MDGVVSPRRKEVMVNKVGEGKKGKRLIKTKDVKVKPKTKVKTNLKQAIDFE